MNKVMPLIVTDICICVFSCSTGMSPNIPSIRCPDVKKICIVIIYFVITNNALARKHPKVKMVSNNRKAIETMYIKLIVALYKMNSSNPLYIAHKNGATNKIWDEILKSKIDSSGKIGYYSGI